MVETSGITSENKETTKNQIVAKEVAEIIDGVSQARVAEFIQTIKEKGILFHGIKDARSIPGIEKDGVRDLTPEGKASYWTSGEAFFCSTIRSDGSLNTYDSTFFHWAMCSDKHSSDRAVFAVAMTTKDALADQQTSGDNYVKVRGVVPKEKIKMLVLRKDSDNENTSRKSGARLEERAFFELEALIGKDLDLGSETLEKRIR